MTTLATPQALAAMRGTTYDPTDLVQAISLEAASAAVRGYCDRQFDYVEDDELTIDGSGGEALLLPELPVYDVAVTYVDPDGDEDEVDTEDYAIDFPNGILYRHNEGCWTRGRQNVLVTYSHGYVLPDETPPDGVQALPDDLQMVVLQIASRVVANPDGRAASAETIGSYSVTYGDRSSNGSTVHATILPLESSVLDRYRLRSLV
jgi:hypothetical protein